MDDLTGEALGASIVAIPGSPATLAITGEIDVSVSEWFSAEMRRQLAAVSDAVVLDLSGVTFIDSSGIAVLLAAARTVEVRINAASDAARRVIELAGLADALGLTP